MAGYPEGKKRYVSLLIAFLLMSSFALLFYQNLITRNSSNDVAKSEANISVEDLMIEEAQKDKPVEKPDEPEKFTFYKTLAKETVRPVVTREAKSEKKTSTQEETGSIKPEQKILIINDSIIKKGLRAGVFSVQIGSFSDFERADEIARELKGKGYGTFITAGKSSTDDTLYRVRVGKYKNYDDAKSVSFELNNKGNFRSIVVKE